MVEGHTEITDSSATVVDLAFRNKPENIVTSGIGQVEISDHSVIYIYTTKKFNITQTTKNYSCKAILELPLK